MLAKKATTTPNATWIIDSFAYSLSFGTRGPKQLEFATRRHARRITPPLITPAYSPHVGLRVVDSDATTRQFRGADLWD